MQSVRTAAAAAKAPPSRAFEKKYGLTLPEVAELFDRPIWKDSARGGNKWAAVTRRIEQPLEARAAGETVYRNRLIHEVLAMAHNTGIVTEKRRGVLRFSCWRVPRGS